MSEAPSSSAPVASSTPVAAPTVGDTATEQTQTEASPSQEVVEASKEEAAVPKIPTEKEIKEAIKKWKLKSQGKTREITDEAELVRLAQLGLGAHEKFEQAAGTRKKAEAVLELIQKDPAKALQSLGLDVRKLAEQYIVDEAQRQMMSPEERQKHEIQQEIQKLKAEKDEMLKQQREERISQLQAKYEVDIQDQIIGAIDKYKLPKNPKTVSRIAEYMASALENGYEASALDVATRVRQDLEEEHKAMFGHYNVEDLLKLLGDDKLKEIRQYEVNKVKAKALPSPVKTEAVPTPKSKDEDEKPKKKYTMDEFQSEMDKYLK